VPASTLIIPVENQVRELDAKLLLAAVAAERGFPVVLGSRAFVHYSLHRLPRGVYLAKSMRKLSDRVFGICRDLGHEILGFDEEALVHAPPEAYYERRLSAAAVRRVSHLVCWGPENAELFAGFTACEGIPLHITGNPRTDLLRVELRNYFAPEVGRIRAAHGPFVLFNSNFGGANSFVPALRETGRTEGINAPGAYSTARAAHRRVLLSHCEAMIPILADALGDTTLIVRPHPAERHDTWESLARKHPNVRVIAEGNVIPWLLASSVTVHNSCTTGLEGTLLDRPVVAFMPVVSELYDDHLPNSLSHRARTLSELVKMVREAQDGRIDVYSGGDKRQIVDHYLEGLTGPLASDRIIDVLTSAGYLDAPPRRSSAFALARGWLQNTVRTGKKMVNRRRKGHRGSAAYHDHRFPAVTAADLQARIARMGDLLNRFERVHVRERSRHLFEIARRR
jgi:surface carbohydrate biosynthesis protein